VLEQNKESTTDLRELEAACGANLFREAGRMLTRLEGRMDHGLLPNRNDGNWLMSWPIALSKLTETYPTLRKTLRADFAPEGRLELRRALEEKNERALESLALRYYGTEEAAEAILWLGDRYLLDGEPALASACFHEALHMAEGAEIRRKIDDRLQLVAALLGQTVTTPAQADIEIGGERLSPVALQALRKKRKEEAVDSRTIANLPPQLAPLPTALDVVSHGSFEGERGENAGAPPYLPASRVRLEVDWFARQVALSTEGNRLFVSNRFQVNCYELPSAKLQWQNALSRDPARQEFPASAYEYPLTPMRPVVVGPRLYVRRLPRGPAPHPNVPPVGVATLVCLDTTTGKVDWQTTNHLEGRLHYVSDPWVIQDQVFAIAEKQPKDADHSLVLMIHNREDGRLLGERPLLSVLSQFDKQRNCQVTALEENCIATVGGSVFCFDLAGNVRWARRQLSAPEETDPHWYVQPHDAPLVVGGRCYLVQPGVLNLLCLAPESGQVSWQKAIPGLRRLAGLVGDRLVVQTDNGFLCLDPTTGKERWRHDVAQLLSGTLCGGPGGLMYTDCVVVPNERDLLEPRLVWLDLETGRERAHISFPNLRHAQPQLGPLFVAGDRLWVFSGKGNNLVRDLLELAPRGQALPETPPPTEWDAWTPTVSGSVRMAAARVLPGWTVFDSKPLEKTGLHAEFKGHRNVLCVAAPLCLGRHIDVPAVAKPRLLLRVATEGKGASELSVYVEGTRIWQQECSSAKTGDGWKDWQVDLSAYKGKRVWVVVRHSPAGVEAIYSYWEKMTLME
jgi:outer membrane protein assembly factor BamB